MADIEPAEDKMAALIAKHKQEKKELQGKTLSMKKSISKTDKKKKKVLNDEIEKMELHLSHRHKSELEAIQSTLNLENGAASDELAETPAEDKAADELKELAVREQRVTKAQRRRDKKAEEARIRETRIAEQEVINRHGRRMRETEAIRGRLKRRGLGLHEIPSDGDCLYAAVRHQLLLSSGEISVSTLRQQTADELRNNPEQYRPFLTDPHTGDMYSDEGYTEYCHQVAGTPAWGGMTEVAALSAALLRPVEVVQAEGAPVVLGAERQGAALLITYHRHMYGLGEHYNSTRVVSDAEHTDSD